MADLLLQRIQGKLISTDGGAQSLAGATQVLHEGELQPLDEAGLESGQSQGQDSDRTQMDIPSRNIEVSGNPSTAESASLTPEGAEVGAAGEPSAGTPSDKTAVAPTEEGSVSKTDDEMQSKLIASSGEPVPSSNYQTSVAQEKTIAFSRPTGSIVSKVMTKRQKTWDRIRKYVIPGLAVLAIGNQLLFPDDDNIGSIKLIPVRPKLPAVLKGNTDPTKSTELYNEGIKLYLDDTVVGYRKAAVKFLDSASYDMSNVKALAMLASSYINLIDSSNKDENYFSVLSKIIDMSRAKGVELPETVIADVEFYLVANKAEAAQNRIIEYTKSRPNFGLEMFYYLALAYYERGDAASAARFISQLPDNKITTPKIFYLRGQIAEKLQDTESALKEYQKALRVSSGHAKSRLRTSVLLNKKGELRNAARHLAFLANHTGLLSPKDLGLAFYLHGQLAELDQDWELALADMERASKLSPESHDYLLELYTLKAKFGEKDEKVQSLARMYYFLSAGERLIQQGKYQDALVPLLQARAANDSSPLPLLKIGDMFNNLHDVENAKINYKLATDRAPNNIQIWSKYIQSLIQSYEWDEATKAMDRFRKLPVSQSTIDKAAADMYQKQGRYPEAQTYYRKAMSRDVVDPEVYIAYAKSLMSTKNFKDAPFFFALALRHDPTNIDALISTAKCVAETESIDKAVNMLQDELAEGAGTRAEFLAAIAELDIQKGTWDQAQANVNAAIQANPDYAYSWKLQAQIYMNQENQQRGALDRALLAYKSYSDRNPSDPSGYLERYKIFAKKADFESAKVELTRIFEIYPKYPNLHFYLGALYGIQGNHKLAADEFKTELTNNPNNLLCVIAYGRELLELNVPQQALDQFMKAMLIDPKSSDAKQNAGWANYQLKNYQSAVALFNSAITLDNANPVLYKRLGIVYRDMGDLASACQAFRKYLQMEPDAPDKGDYTMCM